MSAPVFQLHPEEGPPPVEAPNQTEQFPPPSDPLAVARVLVEEHTEDDTPTIRRWRGQWMRYEGPHWVEDEELTVRTWIYNRLEHAEYMTLNTRTEQYEAKSWQPNRTKVTNVVDALQSATQLRSSLNAPCWIDTGEAANNYIACANGLLDVNTEELVPATPRYFGMVSVPFPYNPECGPATEWLRFLQSVWPDDPESIEVLQEWFGYVLSGRTNLQKGLLMYGPKRSGKGTIARVLTALMGGETNVPGASMASLGTNFGLAPLIGKPLAILGDARLPRDNQSVVIERLLGIIGEDTVHADRKHREPFVGRMPTRLVMLSNELPKFGDASGAIASRFIILHTEESFLGREDLDLEDKLAAELPEILRWAMQGLARLNGKRRIAEPSSVEQSRQQLADLVSPISQFVREECVVLPDAWVELDALFRAWQGWNDAQGTGATGKPRFKADLQAAFPKLKEHRPSGKRRGLLGIGLAQPQAAGQPFGRGAQSSASYNHTEAGYDH